MLERLKTIPREIVAATDYEKFAQERLDETAWQYLTGGAGDEITLQANIAAFKNIYLNSRVLTDVNGGHTQLSLFNHIYDHPILLAPVAYQRLFHPDGELATALGASVMNAPIAISTLSSTLLRDVASVQNSRLWFQLYIQSNREDTLQLIKQAEEYGYEAIIITVDAPIAGLRNREQRIGFQLPLNVSPINLIQFSQQTAPQNNQSSVFNGLLKNAPTWKDIAWLVSQTKLPVLIKGISNSEDALLAIDSGVQGIVVSNHGGRILDTLPASIDCLPRISFVVNGRIPILFDGGIRRGSDIFKALALGASAVLVGRPYIYALASAGALGVAHLLRTLLEELEITMALCGCSSLSQINSSCIFPSK